MPAEHVVHSYPNAGYNEQLPPYLVPDNQFADLHNFYYDSSGKLVSRPGTEFVVSFTEQIQGMGCLPNVGKAVAIQAGSVLYGRSSVTSDLFTSIKTSVAQSRRYFAVMNAILYSGCENGGSGNNLKWDPTSTSATTIGGSPPELAMMVTWNGRMWGVHRTSRTKLYFSKVGDPEDWTTGGVSGAGFIEVGYSDGQSITGLVAHNEQLFIMKERSIWHIVTANPNTDNTLWRVEVVTHQHGCSSHAGIVVVGNDVVFPSSKGIISLNAALYQGDFSLINASEAIPTVAGGVGIYCRPTNQYLTTVTWGTTLDIYGMQGSAQKGIWAKMNLQSALGAKLQPGQHMASDYEPISVGGKFYPGPNVTGMFSLITMLRPQGGGVTHYDVLQYPSMTQLGAGHFDYINGPQGTVPIRKKFTTKMFTFGRMSFDKQSRFVAFSFRKNDKVNASGTGEVPNDELTVSAIFDGDQSKTQSVKVLDNLVNANGATPLHTAVIGIGGSNGRTYRGLQIEIENNIGGYELEYGMLEQDVEMIGNFPRATEHILS